jgi:hypothetical protein
MSPTQYIYLATTLDDEGVSTDNAWIEFPGRIVGGVLSEILAAFGCEVEPLENMEFVGWEFSFRYEGVRFRARVGAIEDFMIVIWVRGGFDFFKRKKRVFDGLVLRLREVLPSDQRFSNIRWYTQKQMDVGDWDYPEKDEEQPEPA